MEIRPMMKTQINDVAAMMARSFMNEDLYQYLIPDEALRQTFLGRFMAFRLRYGLSRGKVFVTDDLRGVAVWLTPGHTMTPLDMIRCGGLKAMRHCSKEDRSRLMAFNNYADEAAARCCPAEHWRLSPIAVDPAAQGQGYGKALMAQGMELLRSDGRPCCLETQSRKNVGFYESLGFRALTSAQIPNSDVPHVVMMWP